MRLLARWELRTSSEASRIPAGRLGSPRGSSWYARSWGGFSGPGGRLPGAVLFWHATATRPATTSRERSESRMASSRLQMARQKARGVPRRKSRVRGQLGTGAKPLCVIWRGRLAGERLLLVVELDVGLVEQGQESAARDIAGPSIGARQ